MDDMEKYALNYAGICIEIEEAEARIKKLKGEKIQVEEDLCLELIDRGEPNTGEIEGVGMLSIVRKNYPSLNAGDIPGFIESIRDTPDFRIVEEKIEPKVLTKFLKEKAQETLKDFQKDSNLIEAMFPDSHYTAEQANKELWARQNVRVFTKAGIKWTKKAFKHPTSETS